MEDIVTKKETGSFRGLSPRSVIRPIGTLALLLVVLLTYSPVVLELYRDWIRDPNYSHGLVIPAISLYLLFSKRKELLHAAVAPSSIGVLGVILAQAILILGTAGAEVFTQRVSLVLLLCSLVLFLWGWRHLRLVAFPLAFLLLAIPLPYIIYYGLTMPMQALAAKVAIMGLKGVGVQAYAQGNIIHLAQVSLEVAEACSGIRSLYAFLAVGALVAYKTPIPLWGRLLLFASAIPLSIAGNAVRVWGTGLGVYLVGPEMAEGTIHEAFGFLVFAICLGIFVFFKRLVRNLWSSDALSPPSSSVSRESTQDSSATAPPSRKKSLHWTDYPEN